MKNIYSNTIFCYTIFSDVAKIMSNYKLNLNRYDYESCKKNCVKSVFDDGFFF